MSKQENPAVTKSRLLLTLGDAVKEVQLCVSYPGGCKRYESNVAARLIHALDQALLDGLRAKKKGYWPVVSRILPSSALSFINQLSSVANTSLAKGRAWLLLSLNEAVLEAFLATLEAKPLLLAEYYTTDALLRDPPSIQVVVTLVSGLEHVGFDFLLDGSAFLNPPQFDYESRCESPIEVDDMDDSFTGADLVPAMNSPLVKRRSHVRPAIQKRVSFHQDQMRRPTDEMLTASHSHLCGYGDYTTNMRRYHSDMAINQSTSSLAKYPTIAERGVPEGQEDPGCPKSEQILSDVSLKAILRRKSLQLKFVQPTVVVDKRQLLDWAKKKWRDSELVPLLPLSPTTIPPNNDTEDIIDPCQIIKEPIQNALIEMDPNERYKSFKCFANFYAGTPRSSQLVISKSSIYIVADLDATPKTVWKVKLIDIKDIQVKWNYSVMLIRSALGDVHFLDFVDPNDLQMAASLIDVNLRQIHQELQLVFVEPASQCQSYWQSIIRQWMERDGLVGKLAIDVEYIGLLYFEESFFLHSQQSGVGPNKCGHLMFRWSTTRSWTAGYFIIKGGVLYQFSHPNDRVPVVKMSLSEEECKGYGRNFHSKRPHTIELQFRDDKSLSLAAASDQEATEWLTSLSQSSFIWDNMAPSCLSVPVACGVLVTRQQVFLFKTAQMAQPVASAPLDIISVIMISLEDTFCLIELDYREASEDGAGDWILYFQSKQSFEEFLRATKRPREILSTASSSTLRNKSLLLRAI